MLFLYIFQEKSEYLLISNANSLLLVGRHVSWPRMTTYVDEANVVEGYFQGHGNRVLLCSIIVCEKFDCYSSWLGSLMIKLTLKKKSTMEDNYKQNYKKGQERYWWWWRGRKYGKFLSKRGILVEGVKKHDHTPLIVVGSPTQCCRIMLFKWVQIFILTII